MLSDGFQEEVAGLGRALFDDVAQAATAAWRSSFKGQEKISQRALSPIRKIYDKLASFSFVDPIVLPITEIIRDALESLPKQGYIEGLPLIQFQGLVSLLRDTEALADLAERKMNGLATDDILAGFIPVEMLQAAEPEEEQDALFENRQTPPPAFDICMEQDGSPSQVGELTQVVEEQDMSGHDHQESASSGQHSQPFLAELVKPLSAQLSVVEERTLSVFSAETTQAAPVFASTPAMQRAERPNGDKLKTGNLQSEIVIPVAPEGMCDFLNGFI